MRRYDDPVEVRKAMVDGPGGSQEGPEQFLWRDRLWKVRAVVAHWVQTGPWWQSSGARAVLGAEEAVSADLSTDLGAEREVWRVEAAPGRGGARGAGHGAGHGVFDLEFDWTRGSWRLVRCLD